MKGSRALTFVLALALMFSLTACDDNGGGGGGEDPEPTLLSEILEDRDELSTLFQAVDASGQLNLTENENANITVLAPNNSAFADINLDAALSEDNSELLSAVVQYHVLPDPVLSSGLSEGTVTTAAGDDIRVTTDEDGNFLINGNAITTADLEADNGVLHVIDGLLLENRTLVERLGLTSSTQALAGLASEAGLAENFATADNWTVFAPINGALENVDPADFSPEQLQQILQYHVIDSDELADIDGPIDAATLESLLAGNGGELEVETLLGESITFTETDDGNIALNGGPAIVDGGTDRFAGGLNEAGDGYVNVFHLIDGLLMPPSMQEPTIAEVREADLGTEVTFTGTVTRAFGAYARVQDESGEDGASGIMIRQTDGDLSEQFQQDIEDGTITEGTVLQVTGELDVFTGTLQINGGGLAEYNVVEQGTAPAPISVSLDDLSGVSGESFESVLIEVAGLSFIEASGEFENGMTYTVQDESGTEFDFRVQNADETELGGNSIPEGTFSFEGILGQFNDNFEDEKGPDEGYQLTPVFSNDLIE